MPLNGAFGQQKAANRSLAVAHKRLYAYICARIRAQQQAPHSMVSRILITLIISTALATAAMAQKLDLNAEFTTCSALEDYEENHHGSGSLMRLSGKYDFMISRAADEAGRPVLWTGTVRAAYGQLSNHGEAAALYPDELLDASVNITHIRPLSGRWSVLISAGVGIYSDLEKFSGNQVLANGAAIFAYRMSRSLDLGVGVGLTNSYGVPMVLPMPYLRWNYAGRFELNVNMVGMVNISGAMRVNQQLKINLDLCDIESVTAITKVDGKWRVFGSTSSKTAIRPEYRMGRATLHLSVGCAWRRSASVTKRSFKDFFHSFNHKRRNTFNPALAIEAGYSYVF